MLPRTPTAKEVLEALTRAVSPRTAYIAAHLRRSISSPVSTARVLRMLRKLERSGLVTCVGHHKGCYGYEWRLNPGAVADWRGKVKDIEFFEGDQWTPEQMRAEQ